MLDLATVLSNLSQLVLIFFLQVLFFFVFVEYFSTHKGCNMICSFLFTPMTKSSKKTPTQLQENTVAEEERSSSTPKKASNEIDKIFAAGKKRKKSEMEKTGKSGEVTKKTDKTKKKKKNLKRNQSDNGKFVDLPSRPRKKTEDGLTVYTEEELGISNADAGNTPLCPFDCSCCF